MYGKEAMRETHSKKVLRAAALVVAALTLMGCRTQDGMEESAPATPMTTATAAPTATPVATPIPTTVLQSAMPTPSPTPNYVGQAICIAEESVNIRAGAGTDSEILGTLPAGETVNVIAYEEDWANVVYDGFTGYVSRDYLLGLHSPDITVPSGDWTLILVNQWSLLPDDYDVTLADFEGGQVDARILDICEAMFADAAEDGVEFTLVDAYRSYETQSAQFEAKVQSYIAQGYSQEEAEAEASTITARPNTSEHQTGLVLDIVTPSYTKRNKGFANTLAFKWLWANAANYGFIMRYPDDKIDITGVIYEPWHWRFVGVTAAQAMRQSGQCLEEYLGG